MTTTGRPTNRWLVFFICSLLFMMAMLFRASNVTIAAELSRDLDLTPETLGFMGAIFFYVFAAAQLPLGLFLDRIGPRRTMVALNLIGSAGAVVFAQSHDLAGGLWGRALLGLGMSVNMMGALKLYTVWFEARKFATITGLTVSIACLGGLLATSPFRLLVEAIGWRSAFYLLALVNFFLVVCLFLWVKDEPPGRRLAPAERPADWIGAVRRAFRRLAFDINYWGVALTMGLRDGVFTAVQTLWAGPFLVFGLGLPIITAGNLLLLLNVGSIIGAPIAGLLADRVFRSPKKAGLLSLVVMSAVLLILANWPGPVRLKSLAAILFTLGFSSPFTSLLFSHVRGLIPTDLTGTAFSGINFFAMMGSGLFLHGMGGVLERSSGGSLEAGGGYQQVLTLCFGAIVLALFVYAFTREARPGTEARESAAGTWDTENRTQPMRKESS